MTRCQHQNGCLFVRGKRRKLWVARWREDVILADGSADRVMRSVVLGHVSEIAGRREARRLLDAHGENIRGLYARQRECTERCCEPARRAIVPKCSQVGELWKYRAEGKSVSSVS